MRINRYTKDYPKGYIVDLLTLPDRSDVLENLLINSLEIFNDNKINVVNCLSIKNHPYESILKRHGFINSRGRVYFIIQLIDIGNEWSDFISAPPDRMHFQYGDTDWI